MLGSSGLHMLPYLNVLISFVVLTMTSYFWHLLYQRAVVVTEVPEATPTKQQPLANACRPARSFELVEELFPCHCLVSHTEG